MATETIPVWARDPEPEAAPAWARTPVPAQSDSDAGVNPYARFVQQPQGTAPDSDGAPTTNPYAQIVRDDLSRKFYAALHAGDKDAAKPIIGEVQRQGMTLAPMTADERNAAFQKANAANVQHMTALQKFLAGAGESVMNTVRGVGQAVGLESPQQIQADQQADQALDNSTAGKIGNVAGQLGQMYVGGLAARDLVGAAGIAGRAAPYVTAALTNAGLSGAQPVAPGHSRLANAAIGAGLGAAGVGVGDLAGRLTPVVSAARKEALATAQRFHIPLHLVQTATGKFTQALGNAARYLPFSGAGAADAAQRAAWNRALLSTVGQEGDEITPAALDAADAAKGQAYDDLFGRTHVALDDKALNDLAGITADAKLGLTPENARLVSNAADRYVNAATQDGAISGPLYQSIRQDVLKTEHGNPFVAAHIRDVRHAMEDAAARSMGPEDTAELQRLNGLHKNIKTLRKALTQSAGANNTVSPASLYHLTQGKYGATPEMLALARLGANTLKSQIGDSGTAQRWMAYRLLGSGGLVGAGMENPKLRPYLYPAAGMLASGMTVGRLFNSPLAARLVPRIAADSARGAQILTHPLPMMLPTAIFNARQAQP